MVTPFTVEPLSSLFGPDMSTKSSQKFRQNELNPSTLHIPNKEVEDFLHILQPNPTDPPPIDVTLTLQNLKQGFRLWRKTTGTSPTGRKLSLYKMWLDEPGNDQIISGDEFPDQEI